MLESAQSQKIVIREEELPVSIQLREANRQVTKNVKKKNVVSTMNEKDIALIVQIIMSQMNTKSEKPLELQLQEINNKTFVNKSHKKDQPLQQNYFN